MPVVDEHVDSGVGVPGHEVRGGRAEDDEAAVGADRGKGAFGVPLVPGAVHAHPFGGAGPPVIDEHVRPPVGVPGHEVGGVGSEGDEAAVGADHGTAATPVVVDDIHAHSFGGAGLTVMHEHVLSPIRVPGHEVGGVRDEGHEAAIGADRRPAARPVPLVPGAVHTDPLGDAGRPVEDKHVDDPVRVPGHEIG